MACMEHECLTCRHVWFNNESVPERCKKCGSTNITSFFDEEPDPPEMETIYDDHDEVD